MKRDEVEWRSEEYEVKDFTPYQSFERPPEARVEFLFLRMGLGEHPSVPYGVVFVHPLTLSLMRGFLVDGDIVYVNDFYPLEVIASPLAFPPILMNGQDVIVPKDADELRDAISRKYRVVYSGGILLHGESFVPPLLLEKNSFVEAVEEFKKEDPNWKKLASLGIPPLEEYVKMVGPFFGFHIPNALQLLEEKSAEDLVREWTGSRLPEKKEIRIGLVKHKDVKMESTGVHGFYPLRTPWRVMVCSRGHVSPLKRCPICGEKTTPAYICPFCGRTYDRGGRCPHDGYDLLSSFTFDPSPVISLAEKKYGRVGDVVIEDGEPEHPFKSYFRKKTNLEVSQEGYVAFEVPVFPSEKTTLPKVLVNPVLRVYRFLSFILREVFGRNEKLPEREEELLGSKIVVVSDKKHFVVEIEEIGDRFGLRKDLFYVLPSKDVTIAVFEDVILNGRISLFYRYHGNHEFPYSFSNERSLFEGEVKPETLVRIYNEVSDVIGADKSYAVPLLFPLLRAIEAKLKKPARYRCKECGTVYHRKPLNKCPRCGGDVVLEEDVEGVDVEDLIETFSDNEKIVSYLKVFRKRLGKREVQRSLLDLI